MFQQRAQFASIFFAFDCENQLRMLKVIRRSDAEYLAYFLHVSCRSGFDACPIGEERTVSRHDHLVFTGNIGDHGPKLMDRIRMQVRLWLFDCQNKIATRAASLGCMPHQA